VLRKRRAEEPKVDAGASFFQHWWFHLPNYALAVLMYACVGRFLLGLFVDPAWNNFIWKGFVRVSDVAVRPVRAVTPAAVPLQVVVAFTFLWLLAARILFFFEMARWGLAPRLTG
jgi:YggT family protein